MEQKVRLGESGGAHWKHSQVIRNEKANVEIERASSSIQVEGKVDRRTKELEKQHRAEGNWFQPELVGEQANYQSRMVWDVTKGDEQMEARSNHQMVWDLTNNCYHQLPVQQQLSHSYLPTYHQLYPCPTPVEQQEDSVALAPTALPLVNLFGGVFMEFVDTLYTSTLVQYVCERTAPSEHRMAAEVLARSNLNPNAKEFNPSCQDLDLSKQELENNSIRKSGPGAIVELSPQGETALSEERDDEWEEVDSQEDGKEELKEKERCANEPGGDVESSSKIEIHTVPLEAACDNSECDIAFEEDGGEEEEEGRELEEEHCEEIAWDDEEVNASEEYEKLVRANKESADEESLEEAADESEDWWDSDEEPCTPSQQIDPAEFEVSIILLPCEF